MDWYVLIHKWQRGLLVARWSWTTGPVFTGMGEL